MYLQIFNLAINKSFTNWFPSIVLPIRSTMDALVFDIFLHIDTLISSIRHFSIRLQLCWTMALPVFPLGFDVHLNQIFRDFNFSLFLSFALKLPYLFIASL